MTDDLVKRLRWLGSTGPGRISFLASEDAMKAADRIETLEAALREIAEISDFRSTHPMSSEADYFRIARKALEGKDD